MFAFRTTLARLWGGPRLGELHRPVAARDWAALFVWSVWFGMIAWLAVFIKHHAHNLPFTDEWAFINIYYGSLREKLNWIIRPHCEHRFILGRTVFLGMLWITSVDFRAGSWVTVVFLAAAAALLILAARKLRGRTHPIDIVFPLLMLHLGHTENLLMGYQLVFTLTVTCLAGFALLIAHCDTLRPATAALGGAALLVPIALGGGQGLSFVPPLGCWVAWQMYRAVRAGGYGRAAIAAVLLLAVGAYAGFAAYEQLSHATRATIRNSPERTLQVAAQVFSLGLGPLGMKEIPAIGWMMMGSSALTALALLVVVIRQPEERAVAGGLLVLLGGACAFALLIGHARDMGRCSRFVSFAALGPAVTMLTIARYIGPVRRHIIWTALVGAIAIVVTWANAVHGNRNAVICDVNYHAFRADVRAGLPIDLLAQRNVRMWLFTTAGWKQLWENGFPLLEKVPGPYTGPVIQSTFVPDDSPDPVPVWGRNCHRIDIPGGQRLLVVRVVFRPEYMISGEPFRFTWTDPETGQPRQSDVDAWVHPSRNNWITFVIRGPITSGKLFMGRPECPITIRRVELLPMQ